MKRTPSPILLLATTNRHKAEEITTLLLPDLKTTPLDYRTFNDYPKSPNIAETGTTFLENATLKATQTFQFFKTEALEPWPQLWGVLSDDSGLVVPALAGAPGVHSARYASSSPAAPEVEQSAANRKKLLAALEPFTTPKERRASFLTTLVFAYKPSPTTPLKDLKIHPVTGQIDGWIAYEERGTEGFGYDSIFIPDLPNLPHPENLPSLSGRTFAEMSPTEKNSNSHRQRALLKFKLFFQELLNQLAFHP